MKTQTQSKAPLMYNGWMIRKQKTPFQGVKFCAYNYRTDIFINPLYNTWEQLKTVIDAVKN
jgi:hypothetical protein